MKINDRLTKCQVKAELTIADMGVWFNTQRRTMETWINGVVPHSCRHSQLNHGLDLLEAAIKEKGNFPVPLSVTQYQRKSYILKVRDAVPGRISKTRSPV